MKKKINIVMLPTEDTKSKVWRNNSTDNLFYFEKTPMVVIRNTYTPQHLYFLSDEEIKVGDYVIDDTGLFGPVEREDVLINPKKIIATTDESLFTLADCPVRGANSSVKYVLPRPANEFLKKYCESGGIDECLVEYEDISYPNLEEEIPQPKKYKLKVVPYNTINVSFIEEKMYSREEVENLIRNAVAESHDWSGENNNIHSIGIIEKRFLNDWIKENL